MRCLKALLAVTLLSAVSAFAQTPVNNTQLGGNAVLTGNGTTGTGSPRVTIASDNTAFSVNATLSAETTKVIGTVRVLGNGGATLDVAQGGATAATNALQTAGVFNTSLPTLTSGQAGAIQLDAKAQALVDLNYIGTNAVLTGNGTTGTGSLRVTISSDNTAFAVNSTLSAETTKVIGTVRTLGNGGATMDVAQGGATAATNALQVAGVYNSSLPTLTTGQGGALQLDSSSRLLIDCATGCSASSTISLIPHTTGGLTNARFVAAATDNATNVKGSAGQVYNVHVYNNAGYPVYLKLYNKATSPTSCGATNLFKVFGVQAGTEFVANTEEGWAMGTGIGYCLTKGITDADDTSVALSDAQVEIGYN